MHDHETEKQKIIQHHETVYDQLQNQFQQQVMDNNQACRCKIDELTKTINGLELKIVQLEQELVEANSLRKHQITELGILREDEKNKINRNYELEIESLKTKIEQDEMSFKKKFKEISEEYESRMKLYAKQSDERAKNLNGTIIDLEDELKMLRGEIKRLRESLDKEKSESYMRIEEEKNSIKKKFQNQMIVKFKIF